MSQHFAGLAADDTVLAVLTVTDEDTTDPNTGLIDPSIGASFLLSIMPPESDIVEFLHTDLEGSFRHRYAHLGGIYSRIHDVFLHPQPGPTWVLNLTTFEWEDPDNPDP